MTAILMRTISDIVEKKSKDYELNLRDAEEWLNSDKFEEFSAKWICEQTDLNLKLLRKATYEMVADGVTKFSRKQLNRYSAGVFKNDGIHYKAHGFKKGLR